MLVIDVSEWQGFPDLKAAHASGIEGIIIRAGYTGSIDKSARWFQQQARGLFSNIGHYFYAYPNGDPYQDADRFVFYANLQPSETVWLDCEEVALGSDYVSKFLSRVDLLAGRTCGIYAGTSWLADRPWMDALIGNRPLWQADYPGQTNVPQSAAPSVRGMRPCGWQFTDRFPVQGIGPTDASRFDSWPSATGGDDQEMLSSEAQSWIIDQLTNDQKTGTVAARLSDSRDKAVRAYVTAYTPVIVQATIEALRGSGLVAGASSLTDAEKAQITAAVQSAMNGLALQVKTG